MAYDQTDNFQCVIHHGYRAAWASTSVTMTIQKSLFPSSERKFACQIIRRIIQIVFLAREKIKIINIEDKFSVGVEPTKNVKKEIARWHCGSASVLALQQCIGVGTAAVHQCWHCSSESVLALQQ